MSTKHITTPARLIDSEARNCSQFGNPRAKLWLELADGSHVIASYSIAQPHSATTIADVQQHT